MKQSNNSIFSEYLLLTTYNFPCISSLLFATLCIMLNFKFKIILVLFLFLILTTYLPRRSLSVGGQLTTKEVFAQDVDSSCDLCGWCGPDVQRVEDGKTVVYKPREWNKCMQCLFPAFSQASGINDTPNDPTKPVYIPYPPITPSFKYPSHSEGSKNWTVFGCMDVAAGGFVSQLYQVLLSIGSGFAFLAFAVGGFTVLTAGGDLDKLKRGKSIIRGAAIGILLIVFSVFILRLIGVNIIKIPGFG